MTSDEEWDQEWRAIHARREIARARMQLAVGSLKERAKDPFGIKEAVRRHPIAAAGVSAGIGALLVNVVLGSLKKKADCAEAVETEHERHASHAGHAKKSTWADDLKATALRVAAPLVVSFLTEKLQGWMGDARAASARTREEVEAANGQDVRDEWPRPV
jgi:hypothetical protein